MRQANWHEEGGNARRLKGCEDETRREHKPPSERRPRRGERAGDQPTHKQALYPRGITRTPSR